MTDSNGSATSPTSGALKINAQNTGGTVSAECDGGSGGVGSIGVFLATASVGRSTTAYLAAGLANLTVGNLSVTANTQHLVTSNTVAAVIGGLAGGERTRRPR